MRSGRNGPRQCLIVDIALISQRQPGLKQWFTQVGNLCSRINTRRLSSLIDSTNPLQAIQRYQGAVRDTQRGE